MRAPAAKHLVIGLRIFGQNYIQRVDAAAKSPDGSGLRKKIDVAEVGHRYTMEFVPILTLAKRLGVSVGVVRQLLASEGVKIRSRGSGQRPKCPELYDLKVGDAIIIDDPGPENPYTRMYEQGKKSNMRLAVQKIAPHCYKITRVG